MTVLPQKRVEKEKKLKNGLLFGALGKLGEADKGPKGQAVEELPEGEGFRGK